MWTDARAAAIDVLRAQITTVEQRGRAHTQAETLPFSISVIDHRLPFGGLLLGAMHELQRARPNTKVVAAPALFAIGVLARRPGLVL